MALALVVLVGTCAVLTAHAAPGPESECRAGQTVEVSAGKVQPPEAVAVVVGRTEVDRPGVASVLLSPIRPAQALALFGDEAGSRAPPVRS